MIIKNLFFRIGQKITSSVCVAVYAFSLFASLILSITSFLPDVANALTVLPNDLSITKTLSGTVYPGAIVETIIDYNNSGPTALSGISISDVYSSGLTLDSIVSSAPDLTISPVTFNHDTIFRTLRRDNISLGTGMSGQIIIRYLVSMSLPENTDVFNSSNVGISCVLCQDPYTVQSTGISVGYINPKPLDPPPPYDLMLEANLLSGDTYNSGDFIDIALDITNDTYESGNIMLDISYKTYLMEFVGVVDSGGIDLPVAYIIHPQLGIGEYSRYNYKDSSKVSRNGFAVATGGTSQIIVRFKMINDYSTAMDVNFEIGIPDEYNIISRIYEIDLSNNTPMVQAQGPEFDLWVTSSILTGDEGAVPGTYSASGTVTVRIEFGNNGLARNNIILMNSVYENNYIGHTGNRDYGPFNTAYPTGFQRTEAQGGYRNNISLANGETGYIDITYKTQPCNSRLVTSRISIIDNYGYSLQSSRPLYLDFISNLTRELNYFNNYDSLYIDSENICLTETRYRDDVIGTVSSSNTGIVNPGEIITFWVPFNIYSSSDLGFSTFSLGITYNTGLSFAGLVATGMNNNVGIVDKLSSSMINMSNKMILLGGNTEGSQLKYTYENPGSFATGSDCGYTTFPTGTPLDQGFPLYPYLENLSFVVTDAYLSGYSGYINQGYNHIKAHAAAIIDVQVLLYSYSLNGSSDSALYDAGEWYYSCLYNRGYVDALNDGYTTGQAMVQGDYYGSFARNNFTNKASVFKLCGGSLSVNYEICRNNVQIMGLVYDDVDLASTFELQTELTLQDAYATNLSIAGFRQLLTNRIIGLYSESRPLSKQYGMISSGNTLASYCSDANCMNNYNINYGPNPNPYPSDYIKIGYDDFLQIKQNFENNMIVSGHWIVRNSGFIESTVLDFIYENIFIDDYTTSGELLLNSKFSHNSTQPYVMGFNFLVNEADSGSVLDFTARIGTNGVCDTFPLYRYSDQPCLITFGGLYYIDTHEPLGGLSGDDALGEDNITGAFVTIGDREPYDLIITKTISQTGNILPNDIVEITTTICNNGTGRSDIGLVETFMPGMVRLNAIGATDLGVGYTLDAMKSRVTWSNISLANSECKFVVTQYQVTNLAITGTVLDFVSYAGNIGIVSSSTLINLASAKVSGLVIAPDPTIYTPYGSKEIILSSFYPGAPIIYRISYSNPGTLTGIMNLYDIYESGLKFSMFLNSTQGLTNMYHNAADRIIMWTGVVIEPGGFYSIDLIFIISTGKNAFDTVQNDFAYDILFIPESYIADADKTNNNSKWVASYSLNILQGTVLDDANGDDLLGGDAPLSGVVVGLSQSSILIATTLTSSTGSYIFTGLLPGLYTLTFTAPSGYVTTRSFTGVINNGILSLNGVSIDALFNGYSSSSTDNATLMKTSTGAFCGNNTVETGEVCDDGANNGLAGYCNNSCSGTSPVSLCGNGVLNGSEQCDDGNNTNGDACSASCQYEMPSCSLSVDSYQSLNPLAVTVNLTGFGFGTMQILSGLTYGDSNDESNLTLMQYVHAYNANGPYTITATVANRINSGLTQTCSISVQATFGGGGSDPYCGNNIREGTEECDGGLLCNSSCEIVIPVCTGTGCEVIHTVALIDPPTNTPIDPPTTGSTKRILYVRDDVIIPKYIKILPHAGAF